MADAHILPQKVIDQLAKAKLPTSGAFPFIPSLVKNKKGETMVKRAEARRAPAALVGRMGWVDQEGRIWIRDYAHAGLPDHWDVQEEDGSTYFRVDNDGNLIPKNEVEQMAHADRKTGHAVREGRPKIGAVPLLRRYPRNPPSLTWGSAAVVEEGDTTVEVDQALDADVWRISINLHGCYITEQLEGSDDLRNLLQFLAQAAPHRPLPLSREFQATRSSIIWSWDDEIPGRLFLWLNRGGNQAIRVDLTQPQAVCIRSALVEATKP